MNRVLCIKINRVYITPFNYIVMAFKWYYGLRENTITKDIQEDYVAIPRKLLSLTSKDLALRIAEERTEYRADTIENIINIYEDMLMKAL